MKGGAVWLSMNVKLHLGTLKPSRQNKMQMCESCSEANEDNISEAITVKPLSWICLTK